MRNFVRPISLESGVLGMTLTVTSVGSVRSREVLAALDLMDVEDPSYVLVRVAVGLQDSSETGLLTMSTSRGEEAIHGE